MSSPVLDVVIPVYNEEAALEPSVRRLAAHLRDTCPFAWRVTIADNASTDGTWRVAQRLAAELPGVRAHHLPLKGRGRALKEAWLASDAAVLAYMDVDLSTDLGALGPLIAPLISGHSDVAIGTRLSSGSRVVRVPLREFTSRCYNVVLRASLGVRFTDAQCGFKAIRADVARELLPWVQDTTWFFDTELLVLAERCRLRIHEVPVDWYDDPNSSVDVTRTALDDLAGVRRLQRSLARELVPVDALAARIGRGSLGNSILGRAGRFAGVGAASTVLHLGVFAGLLAGGMSAQWANVLALVVATCWNTTANRRLTFGLSGRRGLIGHQMLGLGVFALTWALSSLALWGLPAVVPDPPAWLAIGVVAVANVLATIVKYGVFRSAMKAPAASAPSAERAASDQAWPAASLRVARGHSWPSAAAEIEAGPRGADARDMIASLPQLP